VVFSVVINFIFTYLLSR
jgi:Crinkler effector protein N-terminal domain